MGCCFSRARPRPLARGFYMTSYGPDELTGTAPEQAIDTMRQQVAGVSHAVLTVHVRTPSRTSNTISRGPISENPAHLVPWFNMVRSKGLHPWLAIIMHIGDWDWGGFWNPSNPTLALSNYYTAIRPYVQAAEVSGCERLILVDEWSILFSRASSAQPFADLFGRARADFGGRLSMNISNTEEADIRREIATLGDDVGVNAYVPIATTNNPTVALMRNNLLGTSTVPVVASLVSDWRAMWNDDSVVGYMTYVRHLAEKTWERPIVLTTGYQSTVGAAKDPSAQPVTTPDNTIQANAWRAFIDAARDKERGPGDNMVGILAWRWWPGASDDDGATGFSPRDKPAAAAIGVAWS